MTARTGSAPPTQPQPQPSQTVAPGRCPCCGALSLVPPARTAAEPDPLVAVCDVLVVKALESMGKWIVRQERARYRALGNRSYCLAHTLWQPDDATVDRALKAAWDVVPAMLGTYGCNGEAGRLIVSLLDRYVHDLAITGTPHTRDELVYRLRTAVGP